MPVVINGNKVVKINGSLSQINGKWFVNGKEVNLNDLASEVNDDEKEIHITINLAPDSIIEHLDVDSCKTITINGDCRRIKTNMGDINVHGNVDGDVHTNMGDIECDKVGGDAHTNMGNIRYNR